MILYAFMRTVWRIASGAVLVALLLAIERFVGDAGTAFFLTSALLWSAAVIIAYWSFGPMLAKLLLRLRVPPRPEFARRPARRILIIADHSDPLAPVGGEESGGQNIYVHSLASILSAKNFSVDVFTRLSDSGLPREEIARDGYRVVRIEAGPTRFIPKEKIREHLDAFTEGILAFVRRSGLRYDVIHSHYWLSGLAGLEIRRRLALPLVHNFHSLGRIKREALGTGTSADERENAEVQLAAKADAVIATSPYESRLLAKLPGAVNARIHTIPCGVDISRFSPVPKDEAKRAVGFPQAEIAVLYAGRFAAQKGLPVLFRAFEMMRRELAPKLDQHVRLYLAGGAKAGAHESTELGRARTLIARYGLESSVAFLGCIPNAEMPKYYNAADLCVVPSLYEPFGIVPLEAMACGTPVVVARVGGMRSTVQNLRTGFHARAGDVADFAHKLRLLIENENLRIEFGKNGRRRMEETFSWDTVADRIIQLYIHQIRLQRSATRVDAPDGPSARERALAHG